MNGYELSRDWFEFCLDNPEKIRPTHTALYFFAIDLCNKLGWRERFGLPTDVAKMAIGVSNYKTYITTFNDLSEWGFFHVIQRSKNQYSSNIIALVKNGKAHTKASPKHIPKQVQSTVSINKPLKHNNYKSIFDKFRKLYPGTKRGIETEFDNFRKKHKDWECVLPELESIILKQIETRKQKLAVGFAPEWPHLQTWINQRRWEQESPPIENNSVNSLASPEINNHVLPPDIESDYQVYFSQICKLFPSLAKSTCRIYSKDEYFDLRTDRTVTMRKKRITKTEYVKLRLQAHRELNEKAYLRSEYKTVYNYTRHLMRQKLDMYA